MPDHIHLFCSPCSTGSVDLPAWVIYWERQLSKMSPVVRGKWQNDYWDRQMRSASDFHEKMSYVENNPERKGLVSESIKWPYQGILNDVKMTFKVTRIWLH